MTNNIVGLLGALIDILPTLPFWLYGLVNDEAQGMAMYKVYIVCTRQDFVATIDSDRNYRYLKLVCKQEGPAMKFAYTASAGTCTFRKDGKRHPLLEYKPRRTNSLSCRAGTPMVNKYMVSTSARIANKRNRDKATLHHPAKLMAKITKHQKDIHGALMIGNKDIGLTALNKFASFYMDGQQEQTAYELGPDYGGIIPPPLTSTGHTAYDSDDTGKQGSDEQQGKGDDELIETINPFHGCDVIVDE